MKNERTIDGKGFHWRVCNKPKGHSYIKCGSAYGVCVYRAGTSFLKCYSSKKKNKKQQLPFRFDGEQIKDRRKWINKKIECEYQNRDRMRKRIRRKMPFSVEPFLLVCLFVHCCCLYIYVFFTRFQFIDLAASKKNTQYVQFFLSHIYSLPIL